MLKTEVWVGGEHAFALNIGELEALQIATKSSPGEVLNRLYSSLKQPILGKAYTGDVIDTIRLGLIGGGMPSDEAAQLVLRSFERHGLFGLISIASTILMAALSPREDEPVEKPRGEEMPPENGISEVSMSKVEP